MKKFILFILTLVSVIAQNSCANIGRPSGGPKDETPPVFLRGTPMPNTTNYNRKKIDLEFDENIQLEKVAEKVIISPPQREMPEIRANGKKIHIELKDSLIDSTTYVVDFTDAIVDNNEKNPLKDFSYAFSTGSVIDTMRMSGILLNAADLEPVTGMLLGVHSNLEDSALTKLPFEKISQSDALGKFNVKNLAKKEYRIYALKDIDRSYTFSMPNEDLAFTDRIVLPDLIDVMKSDTVYSEDGSVDSVRQVKAVDYLPNDILLLAFNEDVKNRYLDKSERKQRNRLDFFFTASSDSLPVLHPLNFSSEDWYIQEYNATKDTISFWLKDPSVEMNDTLRIEANYLRSDSTLKLVPYADTLQFVYRKAEETEKAEKESKKKKKKEEEEKPEIVFLNITPQFQKDFEITGKTTYQFDEPVVKLDPKFFHVDEKADTLWKSVPFELEGDSVSSRRLTVKRKWEPGKEYRITIDSASVYSLYGKFNNRNEQSFKVKMPEEYSGLFFTMSGLPDSTKVFVELLNDQDKPVRREPVVNNVAEFFYVKPGKYYARAIVDQNGDGKWTTGNYKAKRQPETVYYYSKALDLRQNWDVEQPWNVIELPLEQQKPKAVTKNKPKEKVETKPEEEEENGNGNIIIPGQNNMMNNNMNNGGRPFTPTGSGPR
ncbi:MAG: Ig-like domain-containing protein [Bacteroidales bacterium]